MSWVPPVGGPRPEPERKMRHTSVRFWACYLTAMAGAAPAGAAASQPDRSAPGEKAPETAASTTESDGFQLERIVIQIPTTVKGYVDDDQLDRNQGLYVLRCWISSCPPVTISTSDSPRHTGDRPSLFTALRRLLDAYQRQDLDRVLDLYEPEARTAILKRLKNPAVKKRWLEGIGAIETFEPLMVWAVADKLVCRMRTQSKDKATGKTESGQLTVLCNQRFELKMGAVNSVMNSNLGLYFMNPENRARDLIGNFAYVKKRLEHR